MTTFTCSCMNDPETLADAEMDGRKLGRAMVTALAEGDGSSLGDNCVSINSHIIAMGSLFAFLGLWAKHRIEQPPTMEDIELFCTAIKELAPKEIELLIQAKSEFEVIEKRVAEAVESNDPMRMMAMLEELMNWKEGRT